jgi:hypothetical protein
MTTAAARGFGVFRDALTALDMIREGASCWDPHLQNPDSHHPLGRACDLFSRPHDPTDVARSWIVVHWLTANLTG